MRWLLPRNWTIRTRLTVLYGGMFFAAGAVLLALTYGLVRQSLDDRIPGDRTVFTGSVTQPRVGTPSDTPTVTRPDREAIDRLRAEVTADQERFRDETLDALLWFGTLALGLVGLVAVAFGWLASERVLRPLHRITETATRIGRSRSAGQSGLHERIALSGPRDEITELADTFDAMLERLDRAFDGQRRFVGNASHELRTPLTINRALLEVALSRPDVSGDLRQLGGTLLAVNGRHERLIDGLLTLARSEHEVPERIEVDLAHVVEYVADELAAAAATAGVTVQLDTRATPVHGDPVLLEQLVANLLGNGIRHNVATGGWVRITTGRDPDGMVRLEVSNTGPTVPGYETEVIFEPFRRCGGADRLADRRDDATVGGGVGLGLSIVRAVAAAHGGRAGAEPRAGGGLVVTVVLPAG